MFSRALSSLLCTSISAHVPTELFGAAGPAAVLGVLRNKVDCGPEEMPAGVLAVSQDTQFGIPSLEYPVWILGPGFFLFTWILGFGLTVSAEESVFPVRRLRHLVEQRTENSGVTPASGLKWTFLG